jgi:GTP-binding protein
VDHHELLRCYEEILRSKLRFLSYVPVLFVSALTGKRVDRLLPLIDRVAAARCRRISTGELNRWLRDVDLERGTSPASRRVKIYYVTQASTSPPTFVLFTNQTRPLHFGYERFLENQLRARFDFLGTPIFFRQRLKKR